MLVLYRPPRKEIRLRDTSHSAIPQILYHIQFIEGTFSMPELLMIEKNKAQYQYMAAYMSVSRTIRASRKNAQVKNGRGRT